MGKTFCRNEMSDYEELEEEKMFVADSYTKDLNLNM
jgi:hypothetical protein